MLGPVSAGKPDRQDARRRGGHLPSPGCKNEIIAVRLAAREELSHGKNPHRPPSSIPVRSRETSMSNQPSDELSSLKPAHLLQYPLLPRSEVRISVAKDASLPSSDVRISAAKGAWP